LDTFLPHPIDRDAAPEVFHGRSPVSL